MARDFEDRLAALRAEGRYRRAPQIEPLPGGRGRIEGREAVVLCSNDYLGLARHPELARATAEAAERWGTGAGASRLISGSLPLHAEAETALAAFVGLEAALLFPSGYQANVGAICAVAGEGDLLCSDALNHASVIDGCRLSRAEVQVFPHRDLEALGRLLASRPAARRAWVVTESYFSMDGSEPSLRELAALTARYDAGLLMDEAHALGVFGPDGRGLCAAAHVKPDLLVGTLGKAFGSAGAFVAGSRAAIDWLANRARTFVFTTAVAPPLAGAAVRAVGLVAAAEDRRAHLRALIEETRGVLANAGIEPLPSRGPIQPIVIGDDRRTMALSEALLERGYFIQGIRPPTVPDGTSRLRLTLSAAHRSEDVRAACDALVSVYKTL